MPSTGLGEISRTDTKYWYESIQTRIINPYLDQFSRETISYRSMLGSILTDRRVSIHIFIDPNQLLLRIDPC